MPKTYTREEIESAWNKTLEAQIQTCQRMRAACPTARDTQQTMNNSIVFIGTDMLGDMLPKMRDTYFTLLDAPTVAAQVKNDTIHKTLTKLGIQQ